MSASPPTTLRAWRVPQGTRWALATALMTASVALGVTGHGLLTGLASLGVLMLSALALGGLAAFLLWAYRGDLVVQEATLSLPGGRRLQRRRLRQCRVEEEGRCGVLLLDLKLPEEALRISTGQPIDRVQAFADALIANP